MRSGILAVAAAFLLSGCGSTGSDQADCIQRYAVEAGSSLGAQANYGFCRELHTEHPDRKRRRFLECAIPAAAKAKSEVGARLAIGQCHRS